MWTKSQFEINKLYGISTFFFRTANAMYHICYVLSFNSMSYDHLWPRQHQRHFVNFITSFIVIMMKEVLTKSNVTRRVVICKLTRVSLIRKTSVNQAEYVHLVFISLPIHDVGWFENYLTTWTKQDIN